MTTDGGERFLGAPRFDVVLRGYDRRQVDEHLARLQRVIARLRADLEIARGQHVAPMPPSTPGRGFRPAGTPGRGFRPQPEQPWQGAPPRPAPGPDVVGGFTDRMQSILRAAEEEAAEIRRKARAEAAGDEGLRAQVAELVNQRDAMLAELNRVRGGADADAPDAAAPAGPVPGGGRWAGDDTPGPAPGIQPGSAASGTPTRSVPLPGAVPGAAQPAPRPGPSPRPRPSPAPRRTEVQPPMPGSTGLQPLPGSAGAQPASEGSAGQPLPGTPTPTPQLRPAFGADGGTSQHAVGDRFADEDRGADEPDGTQAGDIAAAEAAAGRGSLFRPRPSPAAPAQAEESGQEERTVAVPPVRPRPSPRPAAEPAQATGAEQTVAVGAVTPSGGTADDEAEGPDSRDGRYGPGTGSADMGSADQGSADQDGADQDGAEPDSAADVESTVVTSAVRPSTERADADESIESADRNETNGNGHHAANGASRPTSAFRSG